MVWGSTWRSKRVPVKKKARPLNSPSVGVAAVLATLAKRTAATPETATEGSRGGMPPLRSEGMKQQAPLGNPASKGYRVADPTAGLERQGTTRIA